VGGARAVRRWRHVRVKSHASGGPRRGKNMVEKARNAGEQSSIRWGWGVRALSDGKEELTCHLN